MKKKKLSAAVRAKISAAVKKAAKQRKQRLLNGEDFKADVKAAFSAGIDGGMPRVVDSKVDFNKTRLLGSRAVDPNVEIKNVQVACRQPENAGQQVDMVNHPPHYNSQVPNIECIEVTRHFSFTRGNAIKYLWRAGHKGSVKEDLKKAIWYIQDEITQLERKEVARLMALPSPPEQNVTIVKFNKVRGKQPGTWKLLGTCKIAKNLASKVKDGVK